MENLPALTGLDLAQRLNNQVYLLIHHHPAARRMLLELAASLARRGPLLVLDGGNCFNVYPVAQMLRRTCGNTRPILERIRAARAFTCYQMAALIRQTPNSTAPVLVPELLTTFLDENTSLGERKRLLAGCLSELHRLSRTAPVLVSCGRHATPPNPADTRPSSAELLEKLVEAADEIWSAEQPEQPPPLRLFPE